MLKKHMKSNISIFGIIYTIVAAVQCTSPVAHADNYTYIQGPTLIESASSTVSAGSTTTLTVNSNTNQELTGSAAQTFVLPDARVLKNGRRFNFSNLSSGSLTVKDATGSVLVIILGSAGAVSNQSTLLLNSNSTLAGTWDAGFPSGTPQFSGLTQYGVMYASTSTTIVSTAAGTAGYPLVANSSAAPTFQQLSLTAGVIGVLPIANGGTNNGSLPVTAGGVIYSDGTKLANTGAGTSGYFLQSAGSGTPIWTASSSSLTAPLITNIFTGSGTFTFTGTPISVRVRICAGGGGGSGGGGAGAVSGATGTNSTFGPITCLPGSSSGQGATAAIGGTCSLGGAADGIVMRGDPTNGINASPAAQGAQGGVGGGSAIWHGGGGGSWAAGTGANAEANSGGGGGGGGAGANNISGQGGTGGGCADALFYGANLSALAGSASYTIGTGGTHGTAGAGGGNGGDGAEGQAEITQYYQ